MKHADACAGRRGTPGQVVGHPPGCAGSLLTANYAGSLLATYKERNEYFYGNRTQISGQPAARESFFIPVSS